MTAEQKETIDDIVKSYLFKNTSLIEKVDLNEETINHIIHMGSDMLAKKWELIPYTSHFVQSVLDNKLQEAIFNADSVNLQCLKFYVSLLYNTAKPVNL